MLFRWLLSFIIALSLFGKSHGTSVQMDVDGCRQDLSDALERQDVQRLSALLSTPGCDSTPLLRRMVHRADYAPLRMLIQNGARMDDLFEYEHTRLFYLAAAHTDDPMLEFLASRLSCRAKDHALNSAIFARNPGAFYNLLRHGSSMHRLEQYVRAQAWWLAARDGHKQLMALLAQRLPSRKQETVKLAMEFAHYQGDQEAWARLQHFDADSDRSNGDALAAQLSRVRLSQ